ncbi:conjugative transfer protein MobI(A/C) [Castellaniella ginsengisoli]|uniref:Conjugative transfer protein MobI(A/C) n=1 Tax=Castellaniella ginsengisoli TaxID=546114 RepID=A0AB39CZ98_9BURK
MTDNKSCCQDFIFIDDLKFSEVSREIEVAIASLAEDIALYVEFCKQHAKLIAREIEIPDEELSDDVFPGDSNVPPVSVRITETTSNFRVEWQRNTPILERSGGVKSFQRSVVRLSDGRLKYPSCIFSVVESAERERFIMAERSLSKIRKQQSVLLEMQRLIRRLEYASKGVVPLDVEVASTATSAESETVHR